MFRNWDWEDSWQTVGLALVVAAAVMLGALCLQTKNVDYYYASNSQGTTAACIYTHWTWHTDEKAFCTDDYQKALDFMSKANAALPKVTQ